jgi:hypothetical protein
MRQAHLHRPQDFKRRILKTNILTRLKTYVEEQRYLSMIKPEEIKPINETPRYYNLCITNNKAWHTYDENIKIIGQKISHSKKGKSTGPCSVEKAKSISDAKKGTKFMDEHKAKLRNAKLGTVRSEEAKRKTSESLKMKWESGEFNRPRKKESVDIKMTREEQGKLCSEQLSNRWANPEWAFKQRQKLKEAWSRRKAGTIQ